MQLSVHLKKVLEDIVHEIGPETGNGLKEENCEYHSALQIVEVHDGFVQKRVNKYACCQQPGQEKPVITL